MADVREYLDRHSAVLEQARTKLDHHKNLDIEMKAWMAAELLLEMAENQEQINSLMLDRIEKLERQTT